MNTKIIAHTRDFIYYREIGELPKLRKIAKVAKDNRIKHRLDMACERLALLLSIPECVENYQRKQYMKG